ncbi:ABC-type Co2+ transport system, permease component [Rubidibacter lacunae KORDI 51-2]|uniref:ABC-type Co2+ transport system, permease component n=1 Tax=Rubidibacter lacunae KORDI 51-2 TaxID=582515 RepID=U5DF66_9CHRO|nr:cobalt transporter CbiM [Rubidibacter lacunae]ERN40251.1 ABC-type Co2+ transport system, permease component [Rubidibacter lacunae KORDI 51-2]
MHVPDGLLPPSTAIAGYAITGGMTWYCLRKIERGNYPSEKIPKASLLTAGFFVASLIHIPIPPASIHLVLNGMMGVTLGYFAFPAVLVGLFFQTVLFQHGGLSTLGVNTAMMGIPALLAYGLFRLLARRSCIRPARAIAAGFWAGSLALALSAAIFCTLVLATLPAEIDAQAERTALWAAAIGYGIQAPIEGAFTAMLVGFLQRVKPELLEDRSAGA